MKYDDLIEAIGDYGPYQKWAYFILCTPSALKATFVMAAVFIFTVPDFKCVGPTPYPTNTTDILANWTSDDQCWILNWTQLARAQEKSYVPQALYTSEQTHIGDVKCNEWSYDTSDFGPTIATEFDFVCDKAVMSSNVNMGFFVGSLVGSVIFGVLADIIGRKLALLMTISVQFFMGVGLYFSPDIVSTAILRSMQGLSGEMFAISASTGMELLGPKKRTFAGMIVEFYWSFGQLLVLLVAYLTREWRVMSLIFGLLALPFFILTLFAPESPRWLLDKGRKDEARVILERIAKSNGTTLPAGALDVKADLATPELSVWALFSSKLLVFRSIIIFYNWYTVNFLYYGLSLNLHTLAGSIYINFFISILVEALGFLIAFFLLERTGRKRLHVIFMFLASVACLLVALPVIYGDEDHQWIVTTLAMVGKMGVGVCYSILYIVTVEIFPTVVRNSALGICMIFENVAGMTSPYVADLGQLVDSGDLTQALPLMVFGVVGFVAATLSIFLPETLHQPLPETIEDAINLGKSKPTRLGSSDPEKKT